MLAGYTIQAPGDGGEFTITRFAKLVGVNYFWSEEGPGGEQSVQSMDCMVIVRMGTTWSSSSEYNPRDSIG